MLSNRTGFPFASVYFLFLVIYTLVPAALTHRNQVRSGGSHSGSDGTRVDGLLNVPQESGYGQPPDSDFGSALRSVQAFLNVTRWTPSWSPWSPLGSSTNMAPWSPMSPGKWLRSNSQRRQLSSASQGELKAMAEVLAAHEVEMTSASAGEPLPVLMALGGGTGASIGGTSSAMVNRDLLRRMHYQDKAVMLLVVMVYFVALWFSATLTFRQACNNSPVTYYADPRFHNLVMEGNDLDVFLDAFNQSPKNIALQVSGFVAVPDDIQGSVRWQGENFQTAFTFSLDLSPWVQRAMRTSAACPRQQVRSLNEGVLPEHRSIVHNLLMHDRNDLTFVEIVKEVAWPDWEELATNIKHQIRQSGFHGVITVNRIDTDEVQVYKNKSWANFMHARATRVLCALSVVGWLVYVPYMWLRCTKVSVRSYYHVDVGIAEYWQLIADKLNTDGFLESARTQVPAPARA